MIEDRDGVALSRGGHVARRGGGANLQLAYGQVTGDRAGSLSWPTAPTDPVPPITCYMAVTQTLTMLQMKLMTP